MRVLPLLSLAQSLAGPLVQASSVTDTPPNVVPLELEVFVEHFVDWTMCPEEKRGPHRHDFHELMLFECGTGTHTIDFQTFQTAPQMLCAISQGQVHGFLDTKGLTGYLLCWNAAFLPSSRVQTVPSLVLSASDMQRVRGLLRVIQTEYERGGSAVLRVLVTALLVLLEDLIGSSAEPQTLEQRFLDLLERHYCVHHEVEFYASVLHCTKDTLSKSLRCATGLSAKRLVTARLLLEARRLLQFSERSVKDIAFDLGFSDPFHFSKAFKRQTGVSPLEYRETRNAPERKRT